MTELHDDVARQDQPPEPAAFSPEELQMATRNHGMPLEALQYDVTPVGLHYLLVHYDIPMADPAEWRLTVDGAVESPLQLDLTDLRAWRRVTRDVTLECAGNGRTRLHPRAVSQPWIHEAVGTGRWTGTPLADVLADVGVSSEAVEVVFWGADRGIEGGDEQRYARSLPVSEALAGDALLVDELNGAPLPPQHGSPLRLVVPGWYGMASVKWLTDIEVVEHPFTGYQQRQAYRFREEADDDGLPLDRIAVRALMIPPGLPDFLTRRRFVDRGVHTLQGRAWSGYGPIERVEVSTDDGATWGDAALTPGTDPAAWVGWRFDWTAQTPGDTVLRCRATDSSGAVQPSVGRWNVGGYAVNAVQQVGVTVR